MNDDPNVFSEERLARLKTEANEKHAQVKLDMDKMTALAESFVKVSAEFRLHASEFAKSVCDINGEIHKCKI